MVTRFRPQQVALAQPPPASPTGPVALPTWSALPLFLIGCALIAIDKVDLLPVGSAGAKWLSAGIDFLGMIGILSAGARLRVSFRGAGPTAAVFLALSLGAPALAAERGVLFGGPDRPALAAAPEPALPLAPGYAVGLTLQADGKLVPQLLAVGSLGLVDLGGRPLSLLLGGGLGAPGLDAVSPTGNLGLAWALPVRGDSEVALGVLATYGAGGAWSGGLTLVVSQLVHRE